jgi:hypothetical protein
MAMPYFHHGKQGRQSDQRGIAAVYAAFPGTALML